MALLKTIYNWFHPAPVPLPIPLIVTPSQVEARSAIARAERDLAQTLAQRKQVDELVCDLRKQLERNHFGEMVEASMRAK